MTTDRDWELGLQAMREKRYPNPTDPRRDRDYGSRRTDYEQKQLLEAILDQLYVIAERLQSNGRPSHE